MKRSTRLFHVEYDMETLRDSSSLPASFTPSDSPTAHHAGDPQRFQSLSHFQAFLPTAHPFVKHVTGPYCKPSTFITIWNWRVSKGSWPYETQILVERDRGKHLSKQMSTIISSRHKCYGENNKVRLELLSNAIGMSSMWLLSTWKLTSLNWDVLSV